MTENNWLEKGCEYYEKKEYEQAVECFREGDKAGDAACTANLGICYYWGNGVDADLQKAAFYNEKAAKAGIPMAMYDTGLNYEYGYGVTQNIEKAIYWLEKAAQEEYGDAFITLGDIYFVGEIVDKDLNKAFHYYKEAERLGLTLAKLFLAGFYAEGNVVEKDLGTVKKLYQEAYDFLYEEAAINNDCEAQFRLGSMFFFGRPEIGIEPDYVQAAEWYLKSVGEGNHQSENSLGIMYYLGLGVGQSYEEAFKWFEKAAERKNVAAICNMGKCYFLGRGVEKDLKKAADCHSKAANLGYANSQQFLGEMYMKGDGVEQNYSKAVYWFKKACDNGERSAFFNLGECYRKGLGVDKDEKAAFEFYQKGRNMGELKAKVAMAECLIEGWGTKCDILQATQLLEDICNDEEEYRELHIAMTSHKDMSGHFFMEDPLDEVNLPYYAKAYFLLGTLYYSEKGSNGGDTSKAIAMLRMAERLGFEDKDQAGKALEELLNKIENEQEQSESVCNSYIEIRDLEKRGKMGRYDIYVHHADGSESYVKFGTDRRKFIYLLILLLISNKDSVQGLMARFFCYGRNRLISLAQKSMLAGDEGNEKWIEKFIYKEVAKTDEYGKEYLTYEYANWMYSNELIKSSEFFSEVCSEDELELFKIRTTGGRDSIASIAISPDQIVIPDSLLVYTKELPSRDFMLKYKSVSRRLQNFAKAKQLNPKKYEEWDEIAGPTGQLLE